MDGDDTNTPIDIIPHEYDSHSSRQVSRTLHEIRIDEIAVGWSSLFIRFPHMFFLYIHSRRGIPPPYVTHPNFRLELLLGYLLYTS